MIRPLQLFPVARGGFAPAPLARVLALGGVLALAGPVFAQGAPPAAGPAPAGAGLAVTVVRAAEKELVERLGVTGTLVPREEVLVGPEIEGLRIIEVLAEEGDRVERGQVLARLSRDVLDAQRAQSDAALARIEAQIAQARSQIAEADAARTEAASALERARTLSRSGNTTDAILEARVAAARGADARLAAAREGIRVAEAQAGETRALRRELEVRLARTELRSPAAGIVSRRTARVGAVASAAGDPLYRIIANGDVELEAEVPESGLARLAAGQPARVEALGRDDAIPGRVRLISPEINRTTRLGRARIALEPPQAGQARPVIGTFARATVETARRRGVSVPVAAVLFAPTGAQVQVVKDGVVETRDVAIGLKAGAEVEIRSGVASGEAVVALAGTFLRSGDRVRAVEPAAAPAARPDAQASAPRPADPSSAPPSTAATATAN